MNRKTNFEESTTKYSILAGRISPIITCGIVIVFLTVCDVILIKLWGGRPWAIGAFAAVNIVGVAQLFLTLIIPIKNMRKQVLKIEEENRQLEQIRREFVANVSHELKTPLTSISGFIETLQNEAGDDPEVRNRFLKIMSIETARLKRLIQDILVLSRIENNPNDSHTDKINIHTSVKDIINSIMPIAEANHIKLCQETEENTFISGGQDEFKQMLVNLIENAIKYSDAGKEVVIGSKTEKGKVNVFVKDQGIGIAKEDIDRLFERFYRVDKSRSRKVGGTGLGLSIVKHLAAIFGAEIKAESQLGKGTTFTIVFDQLHSENI